VILTGGDPLVLPASHLRKAVEGLAAIDHVKILRIHTRVPAVAPERITADVIDAIKARGKATYVVLHANHPRELTQAARAACAQIVDAGMPMLSQSVLLKGSNIWRTASTCAPSSRAGQIFACGQTAGFTARVTGPGKDQGPAFAPLALPAGPMWKSSVAGRPGAAGREI
jgi:hypothetical protein